MEKCLVFLPWWRNSEVLQEDQKIRNVLGMAFALAISCLRLLGSSSYTIAQRTKEISTRKCWERQSRKFPKWSPGTIRFCWESRSFCSLSGLLFSERVACRIPIAGGNALFPVCAFGVGILLIYLLMWVCIPILLPKQIRRRCWKVSRDWTSRLITFSFPDREWTWKSFLPATFYTIFILQGLGYKYLVRLSAVPMVHQILYPWVFLQPSPSGRTNIRSSRVGFYTTGYIADEHFINLSNSFVINRINRINPLKP